MVSIKKVAVLGGTGNLGPSIIRELATAGFSVTGITRSTSTNSTPKFDVEGVRVVTIDYTSLDDLKAAFTGHDAVVSVVGTPAIPVQRLAIDAAIAVGVRRFVPSEFGINTRKVRGTPIGQIIKGKIDIVDYLIEKAEESKGAFTWTGLSTGLFFDWGLDRFGLGIIDVSAGTARILDSGDERWYASTLSHIGRAVAGILAHPEETANKYLATAEFNLSQNELVAVVEELTGKKWPVAARETADEVQKLGEEKLEVGDYRAFTDFLRVHNSRDGAGNGLSEEESANAVLGVSTGDLKAEVRAWLVRKGVEVVA